MKTGQADANIMYVFVKILRCSDLVSSSSTQLLKTAHYCCGQLVLVQALFYEISRKFITVTQDILNQQ
ncbi:hypothetical protein AYI68_g5335 [Smittium mucronatum]|uniref:Uncharacterized protein n=1 Tax=Smittium mucronatum TaxID=133383 RepID=A0A1R0GUK8_9FUNG|nr:hypothetical protein AYI68_g5335 [Smittium mucronatum]